MSVQVATCILKYHQFFTLEKNRQKWEGASFPNAPHKITKKKKEAIPIHQNSSNPINELASIVFHEISSINFCSHDKTFTTALKVY